MESPVKSRKACQIYPVVLCGGSGSRLWPISRALHPKQLHPIDASATMLQATIERAAHPIFRRPIVVSGEEHRFLVREQLEEIDAEAEAIILEPKGRNTAAAVAIAALFVEAHAENGLILVMPSDHVIRDFTALIEAVMTAIPAAEAGALVTFGILPRSVETGYGYIEAGPADAAVTGVLPVMRFVEKPDKTAAESFCASGRHYWNSGIFLFQAKTILKELRLHAAPIEAACRKAMIESQSDGNFIRPAASHFLASPIASIDTAVMEHTRLASVVPVEMGWSDVGSWAALWEITDKDDHGNALRGDVLALDTLNSLVRSDADVMVTTIGLENMVVVATRDAVLVVPRERSQETRTVVDALSSSGRSTHVTHSQVHRPWGSYETMDSGERFQIKHIIVKPGAKLSLQKHQHRSEHWVVVSGVARVTVDDDVRLLHENESTYVPIGSTHRLENPGSVPLHLVEVQCGTYLGEDDIVRFDDDYGRNSGSSVSAIRKP
jgi:mannose-1-phosphate guanylyltransferase/mannose-6-phosphate isomerase